VVSNNINSRDRSCVLFRKKSWVIHVVDVIAIINIEGRTKCLVLREFGGLDS
jgi:hypothetical protein